MPKYKSPDGRVFDHILNAKVHFCRGRNSKIKFYCAACPIYEKCGEYPCSHWVNRHESEAARLMGCEIIEDEQADTQEAKADKDKPRPSLVPKTFVQAAVAIHDFEKKQEERKIPRLINAHKGGKGTFECPYCGKYFEAWIGNVKKGKTHSCGCMKGKFMVESKNTHGETKTRLYRTYAHIKERCRNPNCKEYKWYGAKGIECKFDSFEDFRDFALANGYNDDLTCERIDVNGNYEPGNITFIPAWMQARNRTSSVMLTYKGITLCAAEWAEIMGVNQDTITKRKRSGWSDDEALEKKANEKWPDMSLIQPALIKAARAARLYGVKKYGSPDNWRNVEASRYWDALLRHVLAAWDNWRAVDPESGLPHLHHIICNAGFLAQYMEDEKR